MIIKIFKYLLGIPLINKIVLFEMSSLFVFCFFGLCKLINYFFFSEISNKKIYCIFDKNSIA